MVSRWSEKCKINKIWDEDQYQNACHYKTWRWYFHRKVSNSTKKSKFGQEFYRLNWTLPYSVRTLFHFIRFLFQFFLCEFRFFMNSSNRFVSLGSLIVSFFVFHAFMYINRKSDNKSAIKRSNDRACVHRQAVADYRSHFKRMAGPDSEYEWMTKWISNKLLIRLIFLSSTSHFPLLDRLICIYTLHVVWKWIQISRHYLCQCHIISQPTVHITDTHYTDRLLLVRLMNNRWEWKTVRDARFFIQYAHFNRVVYLICSCVNSYNVRIVYVCVCAHCNQNNIQIVYWEISKHRFNLCRKDGHWTATWCLLFQLNTQYSEFLAFVLLPNQKWWSN